MVYPLGDLVRQVGGAYVNVESICETSQDPRDLEVTDDFRHRLANADLVVLSGYGDTWLSRVFSKDTHANQLISPELTPVGKSEQLGAADLWLDPVAARQTIDLIRQQLASKDPPHEAAYRANADVAATSIEALDAKFAAALAPMKGRTFLTLRPTWGLFAKRYGLVEISPLDTPAEQVSEEDVRVLRAAAKRRNTNLLVIDAYMTSGVARDLESKTGLKMIRLDRMGSSAPDARSTYQRIMEYNLEALLKGFAAADAP